MHNEGFLCAAWAPSMRFGKASGLMALASKGPNRKSRPDCLYRHLRGPGLHKWLYISPATRRCGVTASLTQLRELCDASEFHAAEQLTDALRTRAGHRTLETAKYGDVRGRRPLR